MKPAIPFLSATLAATLAAVLSAPCVLAQTAPPAPKPNVDLVERTFFLKNASQPSDANEIFTAIRQLLPANTKCFLIPSENAIIVNGTPDENVLAERLITELDRPRKSYRLTYTVTEMDGAKPVGVQHYSMVAASGQQTTLKEGSRVPLVTGAYDPSNKTQSSQISYVDVGMNFDATLTELGDGGVIRSSVEQSSVAVGESGVGPQDPVLRETSVKGEAFLTPGKPLMLGSLDIPGTSRHLDIEVVMEKLP